MVAADPSEAIRSADILRALHAEFEILERRDIGGTLGHLALGDIAQNFDVAEGEHVRHLRRLFSLEDHLIKKGTIGSDFVVLTAVPRRLDVPGEEASGGAGVRVANPAEELDVAVAGPLPDGESPAWRPPQS